MNWLRLNPTVPGELGEMITTVNPMQTELDGEDPSCRPVPQFVRLFVIGRLGQDDAGIDVTHQFVVSDRLWAVLRTFRMGGCEVAPSSA